MNTEMITVREYCLQYETEQSFISALEDNGLLTVTIVETEPCIHYDDLHSLDTYRSWYYDMNINVEGIDALTHVLGKIRQLQQQVQMLRSRLRLYEE
jgi:chaperone modulatory protein CbpM